MLGLLSRFLEKAGTKTRAKSNWLKNQNTVRNCIIKHGLFATLRAMLCLCRNLHDSGHDSGAGPLSVMADAQSGMAAPWFFVSACG